MRSSSGQVFVAGMAARKFFLPFEGDWQNQDINNKSSLQAHLYPGGLVVIEGALSKPSNIGLHRVTSVFPAELRPAVIHSGNTVELSQNNRRRYARWQLYPSGELKISGGVAFGSSTPQVYISLVYQVNNGPSTFS